MSLLQWNDSLSVGVQSIDEQHKNLVSMLNHLSDEMKLGKGKDALGPILDGLINYTATHFKYEEELFEKTHYPETVGHKKEHEALVKRVLETQAKLKAGNATLTIDVMDFLSSWLTNHIMKTDKKYAPHLIANGIK